MLKLKIRILETEEAGVSPDTCWHEEAVVQAPEDCYATVAQGSRPQLETMKNRILRIEQWA
jgi:hypothetical protein